MNLRWTTHLVWGGLALAAFVIGAAYFPKVAVPGDGGRGARRYALGKGETIGGGGAANGVGGAETGGVRFGGDDGTGAPVLSEVEIKALGEVLRAAGSPVEKRAVFSKLLAGLTAENALLIRAQIEHLDDGSGEFRDFHYAWGVVDGQVATMFGADTPEDDMAPVLAGWASSDPGGALAWLEAQDLENDPAFAALVGDRAIPVEDLRNHLMGGLVRGLAANDPDRAVGVVEELVDGGNRAGYSMMRSVVDTVLRSGAAEAVEWAERIGNGELRYLAMEQVAGRMLRADFDGAVEWALAVSEKPEGGGVVASVGGAIASRNPAEAMEWLGGLADGQGKVRGIGRAMWQWTERDAGAASEYLSSMVVGRDRDAAVGAFSRRLAREDPETAVSWAATIGNEGERQRVLVETGREWRKRDLDGAIAWVQDSGLPEHVQLEILSPEVER